MLKRSGEEMNWVEKARSGQNREGVKNIRSENNFGGEKRKREEETRERICKTASISERQWRTMERLFWAENWAKGERFLPLHSSKLEPGALDKGRPGASMDAPDVGL